MGIRRAITASLSVVLLGFACSACALGDIVLGARGGAAGRAGSETPLAGSGGGMLVGAADGGRASVAGEGGATAGSSGQSAGSSAGAGDIIGTGGALATGGIGAAGSPAVTGAAGTANPAQMSLGCGMDPRASDTSIQVNGMTGTYILDLPKGYDKTRPYPLIMSFRGAGVTADAFRTYLNLVPVVGADAIVINPNCLGDASAWDVQRDLPYFDALLVQLESAYCIDEHRIFVVGHSAGGFFASTLGCARGNQLRGVAPLSAGPPTGTCQGEFAVWMSQGNADMSIGPGRADRDFWVQRNRCDATMFVAADPSPCVDYAACDVGFPVRYCEYDGDLGLPDFAAAGLWEFFKGF
jgi:polyhydroxybutyrate depolymerase